MHRHGRGHRLLPRRRLRAVAGWSTGLVRLQRENYGLISDNAAEMLTGVSVLYIAFKNENTKNQVRTTKGGPLIYRL